MSVAQLSLAKILFSYYFRGCKAKKRPRKTKKKECRSATKQCKGCPLQFSCLGKTAKEKKFSVTYYRAAYQRNIARIAPKRGRYMKSKRQIL